MESFITLGGGERLARGESVIDGDVEIVEIGEDSGDSIFTFSLTVSTKFHSGCIDMRYNGIMVDSCRR